MMIEKIKIRKLKFSKPWESFLTVKYGSHIPSKNVSATIEGNKTNRDVFAKYIYYQKNKINDIIFYNFNYNWCWNMKFKRCITEKEAKKIIRKQYKKDVKYYLNKIIEL